MYFISSIHQIFPKIFTQKKIKKNKDYYYHVKTEWEWSKRKWGRKKTFQNSSKTHLFSQFLELSIPGVPNLSQMKNFQFSLCLKSALSIYPKTRDRRMIRKRALIWRSKVERGSGATPGIPSTVIFSNFSESHKQSQIYKLLTPSNC